MGNHKIVVDGVTKDLQDDFSISVESSAGMGIPPVNNLNTELALQAGALIEGQTYQARVMTWNCLLSGDNQNDFHDKRQAFIKALDTQTGKINERPTEIEVQYTGATVDKKINVVYDGGLEGNNWNSAFTEHFSLRLRADDPIFKSTATATTTPLDSEDSATFTSVLKREGDKSAPIYNTMNAPASGITPEINEIVIDDTYVYYGGDITNFDGIANADYIARWHIVNEAWSALGTGADDTVRTMIIGADGTLYAAGDFANIGGASFSAGFGVASWNGSAWAAIGTGVGANNKIEDLVISDNGDLYALGTFTTMDGVTVNRVSKWDGSTWTALTDGGGTGLGNNSAFCGVWSNNTLYIGGSFTTAGGTTVNRLASWDGSDWGTFGTGTGANNSVLEMEVAKSGDIYIGGQFTSVDGGSASRAAVFRGGEWVTLGDGLNNTVNYLRIADSGEVYYSGRFTTAGGGNIARVAIWNGSTWTGIDFDTTSLSEGLLILPDSDGNLWGGSTFDTMGAVGFSGDTTISYAGTAKSYPQITINRDGGTSAKLVQIKNETTGATLHFDYDLLDGETLTLEFDQREGALMKSSAKGNVFASLLANSNFGTFYLTPGNGSGTNDNVITLFVDNDGATITSNIIYTINYISAD